MDVDLALDHRAVPEEGYRSGKKKAYESGVSAKRGLTNLHQGARKS